MLFLLSNPALYVCPRPRPLLHILGHRWLGSAAVGGSDTRRYDRRPEHGGNGSMVAEGEDEVFLVHLGFAFDRPLVVLTEPCGPCHFGTTVTQYVILRW